ncbi:hypothetical protein OKW35_000550 [Paraburkholderia sp. MM5477-R1]
MRAVDRLTRATFHLNVGAMLAATVLFVPVLAWLRSTGESRAAHLNCEPCPRLRHQRLLRMPVREAVRASSAR